MAVFWRSSANLEHDRRLRDEVFCDNLEFDRGRFQRTEESGIEDQMYEKFRWLKESLATGGLDAGHLESKSEGPLK